MELESERNFGTIFVFLLPLIFLLKVDVIHKYEKLKWVCGSSF